MRGQVFIRVPSTNNGLCLQKNASLKEEICFKFVFMAVAAKG